MNYWERKWLLTTKELIAILEEDWDVENIDQVATYIPPAVDEITDGEDINENLTQVGVIEGEIAGTYKIYMESDSDDDNIPLCEFIDTWKNVLTLRQYIKIMDVLKK